LPPKSGCFGQGNGERGERTMTTTTAGFTLDTLARKRLEKLRRQEKN
jgi:hypothetical protein